MIGYTLVGSNDLPRARQFYDTVFGSVGIGLLMEFPTGAFAYGSDWSRPMFGVGTPYDGQAATIGNGTMIALVFDDRAKVVTVYDAAIQAGGTCEGPPGVRGDEGEQAFYGAYFRDLDGNKLCAFCIGAAKEQAAG